MGTKGDAAGVGTGAMREAAPFAPTVTVVRPPSGLAILGLADVWSYRELLFFLTWRDLKVRYKHTILGAAWAVLQPLATMLVFTVVFGRLANVPSEGRPYHVYAFAGLVAWQLFARALTESGNSLVANENLISKVYFPRLIMPLSAALAGVVDFGASLLILIVMMTAAGIPLGPTAFALPLFFALLLLVAVSMGIWLAALNVHYRDVRYTLPLLSQLWLLATPVAYPAALLPEQWKGILALNPMAGAVLGFRWALLGTSPPDLDLVAASALISILLLVTGLAYFRRVEWEFADVI